MNAVNENKTSCATAPNVRSDNDELKYSIIIIEGNNMNAVKTEEDFSVINKELRLNTQSFEDYKNEVENKILIDRAAQNRWARLRNIHKKQIQININKVIKSIVEYEEFDLYTKE